MHDLVNNQVSSRLPLRWPFSGLWIDVPPALSGSATALTFGALLPGLRQCPGRGLTGQLLGVPPALDRSPCGRVIHAQAQSILSPSTARGIGGAWSFTGRVLALRIWHPGLASGPLKTEFPETLTGGASTPASPSSPRNCGGLLFLSLSHLRDVIPQEWKPLKYHVILRFCAVPVWYQFSETPPAPGLNSGAIWGRRRPISQCENEPFAGELSEDFAVLPSTPAEASWVAPLARKAPAGVSASPGRAYLVWPPVWPPGRVAKGR